MTTQLSIFSTKYTIDQHGVSELWPPVIISKFSTSWENKLHQMVKKMEIRTRTDYFELFFTINGKKDRIKTHNIILLPDFAKLLNWTQFCKKVDELVLFINREVRTVKGSPTRILHAIYGPFSFQTWKFPRFFEKFYL